MLSEKGEMLSGKVSKSLACWQKILPWEIRPTLRGSRRSLVNPKTCVGHSPQCLTIISCPNYAQACKNGDKSYVTLMFLPKNTFIQEPLFRIYKQLFAGHFYSILIFSEAFSPAQG